MTDLPEDRVAPHRAADTGSRDALVTPLRRDPRRHGRGASLREHVEELAHRRHDVVDGDARATHRQHASGKLTARERIDLLLDPGTFCELESMRRHRATGFGVEHRRPHTDGVVTGWGSIHGTKVFVYAHDFRIFGGSLGEAHAAKIHKVMDLARPWGRPSSA